ncbi:MAG TPA: type VI secretion system-associated protein TagF [Steroidobacteraceae bacterium]|nr:type VI secretion system-associated protein TagF [Steroidobacteraceae bacterium]
MWGANVGFFGKLPSNGDFIERRVSGPFRDLWDDWMQRCMVESQRELGGRWLDCYLTSPIWRFFLSDGIAGGSSYAGVLLPSVDRVGRYFPFTVVVELPVGIPAVEFARAAANWFTQIEHLCADALQNPDFDLTRFDAALQDSAGQLAGIDRLSATRPFPGGSTQWHWPCSSASSFTEALSAPLIGMAQSALRPMTMWWTDGSDLVHPGVLLTRSLPRPDSFHALLAGTWDDGRWDGEADPAPQPETSGDTLEFAAQFGIQSAGATDAGTVRQDNQDNFLLNDDNRLWAVADGMGGHSHGEIASQMVVDALNALEPAASLNTCLQSVGVALDRVNADLRRAALGVGAGAGSGSTVVVLAIRGREWGVSWAGDSRAYVYRDASLLQLTRDHTVGADESIAPAALSPDTPAVVSPATPVAVPPVTPVVVPPVTPVLIPSAPPAAMSPTSTTPIAATSPAGVLAGSPAELISDATALPDQAGLGVGSALGGAAVLAGGSALGGALGSGSTLGSSSAPGTGGALGSGAGSSAPGAPGAAGGSDSGGVAAAAIGANSPGAASSGEITRAVGGHDVLELDRIADLAAPGDRFLLCSDGLYGALSDSVMISCLQRSTPREASAALIEAAREAGARDNVTAVIVDVKA